MYGMKRVLYKYGIIMPPFDVEGVYCFAHVGQCVGRDISPSVDKPYPINN